MPITRRFTVYTNAGVSVPPVIHVNQYDRGETWIFTLLEPDGSKYSPASGGIVGIKADGHAIINTATVNGNGEVVVSETQQMTAAAGKAVYEIIFDNSTHGTANFIVCVEPKPGDNATLSDSDLSLIQEAIESTIPANIEASVQDWMDDNLAPAEWVIDNTLSIAGAAADAKKVGDVTSELKTAITGFETTFTASSVGTKKFNATIFKNGKYTYTNNTSASVSVNVYDENDNATTIYGGLGAGQSITFTAEDDYVKIGGYFNAAGTVTLTCKGTSKGINENSVVIAEHSTEIEVMENITSGYSEEIAITTPQASKVHYTTMKKGVMYAIKNKTAGTVLINVYTAENEGKLITSSLAPNDTVKWIAENDYVRISAYCNNTGTLVFYHDNVYADIIEALTENDSWIQTISNAISGAVSALTVIDGKLYVFPYVSNNGNTTGKIFNIDTFGKLTDSGETFTSNIGHQNTVDYSKYNHCLLASRYTMADGITDFSVYVFQNVTGETNEFDIADAVKLDMSIIGGDTLDAIWAGRNYGRNDLIYVLTRDNTEGKQYYSLVQLGKGSNELPSGTMISGVSSSAFNGTFKVLSTIEKSLTSESGVLEYINDACLHNGKIYKCVVQSMGGSAYMTDEIVGFGNDIESKEYLFPQVNQAGGVPDIESEGITIHNGHLYIGSYGHGINVFTINA